jgi:uncharacterized protein YbgA (DUF1722 family)
MSTPRESLRLERDPDAPVAPAGPTADPGFVPLQSVRMVAPRSGTDWTERMRAWSERRLDRLEALDLSGYVLKRASPSCGMERVRVYDANGVPTKDGRGLFAEALMRRLPDLPVEEEGRLHDPALRETFFVRVFAYRRLHDFLETDWTVGDLVAFHTAEKFLLLAQDPSRYRVLGRIVAHAKGRPRDEVAAEYRRAYLDAMARVIDRKRHVNVLQHVIGYFRDVLDPEERAEIRDVLEDYRTGLLPLVVPLTLVRHYVRVRRIEYLMGQRYLEPGPKELMLRARG